MREKPLYLRRFTASLNSSLYKAVYFPLSTLTVTDFYRGLTRGLGEEPKARKITMFGQIQYFLERVKLTHNQPLAQSVVMRYSVNSLSKEEVRQCIEHHLKLAGGNHPIFSAQAIETIASR